jgi:hypothetical protein
MRALMLSLSLVVAAACSGRQVEVRTGPEPATDVALHVTNNLSQPVNVYVQSGASDIFLKQVAANTVEHIPVSGVAAGSTVNLKAVTVDGKSTYTKSNVTLNSMYDWRLP